MLSIGRERISAQENQHQDRNYPHESDSIDEASQAVAGVTTNWRSTRSRKVTGPRGPGTASILIPVSGTWSSLNPSSSLVVAFQKAPVPVYAPRNSAAASSSVAAIPAARPEVSSLAMAAASAGPLAGAMVTVASRSESSAHS